MFRSVPRRMPGIAALLVAALLAGGCSSLGTPRPETLRDQAASAYAAGAYSDAARGYARYLDRHPDDAQAWYRLGYAHAQLGRLAAAEAAFRRALDLDPEMARARHNLGVVQIQLGVEAILAARRQLPDVDPAAARTMEYLACLMETFMGYPRPQTCEPQGDGGAGMD